MTGKLDSAVGMVMNITEVKAALVETLAPLDGAFLDAGHPDFTDAIPTTEVLAQRIFRGVSERLKPHNVTRLRVAESRSLWSDTEGEGDRVTLTRLYEFSAAHRLHSQALSAEENVRVFGKCNNPRGHGHNYGVAISVAGDVDPDTGMVADLARLDRVVAERVVDRMDHRHLNHELPEFATLNPTSENLAVVIWNLLKPELGAALVKVTIHETERNTFEFTGA